MLPTRRLAVLAAFLLLLAPAAQADIASFADLTDLRLSVIDLTPDDGVPAGYTLLDTANAWAYGSLQHDSQIVLDEHRAPGWLAATEAQASLPGLQFSASAGTDLHAAGGNVPVTSNMYNANAGSSTGLTLAPHTRLQLDGNYRVSIDFGGYQPAGTDSGYLLAQVQLFGMLDGVSQEDLRSFSINTDAAPFPDRLFDEGALSIALVNDTDGFLQGELVVDAAAGGTVWDWSHPPPPPVPEPASTLLLALGLGVLGLRRRPLRYPWHHVERHPRRTALGAGH